MADINITRQHGMTLAEARKAAFKWTAQAEEKFDIVCTYEEGKTADDMSFTRSGVSGNLHVNKDSFKLTVKLGFLLGAFKDKIEGEIVKNLDALIAKKRSATKKMAVETPVPKKLSGKKV